jgi:hypothetical protein
MSERLTLPRSQIEDASYSFSLSLRTSLPVCLRPENLVHFVW